MSRPEVKYVKYSPDYKDAILLLLRYMWRDMDDNERQLKFDWRYEKNPYHEPYIYLAMDGEKIIAFRAFIAQVFIFREKMYTVFSPSDTIVHPDYRRMGIMSRLNDIAIDEIYKENETNDTFLLNTTTSKKSMPVYIKEHWQGTNILKHFYYRIYPLHLFFNRSKAIRQQSDIATGHFPKKGHEIVISKKITGEELSVFIAKNRNNQLLTNIRDKAFYDWKYEYQADKYTLILCKKDNEILAYAITKYLSRGKYSLEEYVTTDRKAFQIMLKEAQKRMKFSVLRSWALYKADKTLLNKCGFFPEPARLLDKIGEKRFPILVRPIVPIPSERDFFLEKADIRKIENWHLQIADRH